MLSVGVEDKFASIIDEFISKSGRYSSRSEFLKDSIRKNLDEQMKSEEWRRKFMESVLELRKKAYANGYDGSLLTREERAKIADEYFAKKGIDIKKQLQ
jgi:Arc/MetJ-type ribon-helix-helix transcriptional regulator